MSIPYDKQRTIEWLTALGKPSFPIDPQENLLNNRAEKQPAYYQGNSLRVLNWKEFQNWHEKDPALRKKLLKLWHGDHRIKGISTIGGFNGQFWLFWVDFDVDNFESPEQMRERITHWVNRYHLDKVPAFTTPSGGMRYLFKSNSNPSGWGANNGFTFIEGSSHKLGEILATNGGHTLLPPTTGSNGKAYQWVSNPLGEPYPIESLESVGLFKVQPKSATSPSYTRSDSELSDTEKALLYLDAVGSYRADDYEQWVKVGQALHSVSDSLLPDWDRWSRQSSKYKDGDCEKKWRSFRKDGKITLGTLYHMATEDGFKYPQQKTFTKQSQNTQKTNASNIPNPTGSISAVVPDDSKLREILVEKFTKLAQSNPDLGTVIFEVNEAQKMTGWQVLELHKLYSEIEGKLDHDIELGQQIESFRELTEIQKAQINLSDYLPSSIGEALTNKATIDRLDPVRLLQSLLPAMGTVLGAKVAIQVKAGATEADSWIEYPIVWTADISPPSSGKSNVNRAILYPLHQMQQQENTRVEAMLTQLEAVKAEWDTMDKGDKKAYYDDPDVNPFLFEKTYCKARKWIFDLGEIEAILRRISEQDEYQGCLWSADELAGLFSGLDQYKGKDKGNAKQILLEAWNGRLYKKVDRVKASESFQMKGQTLNLTGGIQPTVARRIFDAISDPDGLTSRILFAQPQLPDDFAVWNDDPVDVNNYLTALYDALSDYPQTLCKFDANAQSLYAELWSRVREEYRDNLKSNEAYAYWLGKQLSYIPRLCLLIHACACTVGESEIETVTEDSLLKAYELSKYYGDQFKLLQAVDTNELNGILLEIYNYARSKGTVSHRDIVVHRKFNKLKVNSARAKSYLAELLNLGYCTQKEGKYYF